MLSIMTFWLLLLEYGSVPEPVLENSFNIS